TGTGATTATYTPTEGDEGGKLLVQVTYAETAGSWQSEAAFLPGAIAGAADLVNGKVYAFDGIQSNSVSGSPSNALSIYDTTTNSWTSSSATDVVARQRLASAVDSSGRIYLVDGADSGGSAIGTLDRYDPTTGTFTTLTPDPIAREDIGAAIGSDGKLYVIGGVNGSSTLSTVESYDPKTNSWTARAALPFAADDPAVVAFGSNIYVFGGFNNGAVLSNVQIYNT